MTDRSRRLGPLPLRLMSGAGFLYHGLPKLDPSGHDAFATMLQGIGVPSPELVAWMVAALEVGGAILLLVGFLVRAVAIPLIVEMLVAMVKVHWPHGFGAVNITGTGPAGPTFGMPGIELNLLYIAILAALWFLGAGRLSVDDRRRRPIPAEPAFLITRTTREPVGT